jgi:hypothetical protein
MKLSISREKETERERERERVRQRKKERNKETKEREVKTTGRKSEVHFINSTAFVLLQCCVECFKDSVGCGTE